MPSPITGYKNNNLLFEDKNIQEAARFLEEHIGSSKYKYYDHIPPNQNNYSSKDSKSDHSMRYSF